MPSRSIAIAVFAAISACTDADTNGVAAAPVERDSAGVLIVENPRTDALPRWTVDSVPSVSVGVAEGDAHQEFGTIGGVALLNGGVIAVLDGRGETAFEFRLFDSTGRHIATHGRFGQGPGEFTWVNHFSSYSGDTIIAIDFPNRRLNYLTVSRGYIRSLPLDEVKLKAHIAPDASGLVEGMVPFDDSLFAVVAFRPRPGATTPFARFNSFHIVDMRAGTAPELARHDEPDGKPVPALAAKRMSVFPVDPAVPAHVVDRARKRICVAITNRTEISCVDTSGRRSIIRWHADSVAFTSDDRARFIDRIRARLARGNYFTPSEIDAYVGALEFPEWFNPFTVVRVDDTGKAERFRILDPSGRQIAFANPFPARNVGLGSREYFGAESILRVYEDSDGVQAVGVFRIQR
jgi:hypothetical protein